MSVVIDASMATAWLLPDEKMAATDEVLDHDVDVLALARTPALTAYEAAHLALARAESAGLAALDKKRAAAARRETVALLGPLAP